MIKKDQEKFYSAIGKALTVARQRRNMSIASLATKSGEQYITIVSIESGKVCSLHHTVWMKSILGLDVNKINMEGKGDKESKGLNDLI
jgi:hypothetical protein